MNYNELRDYCKRKQISTTSVAADTGITLSGLKKALDSQSLSMRLIPAFCRSLCITPNQLFGFEDGKYGITQIQNGGKDNKQTVCADSLQELQNQLKVKDEQIGKLLDILNK